MADWRGGRDQVGISRAWPRPPGFSPLPHIPALQLRGQPGNQRCSVPPRAPQQHCTSLGTSRTARTAGGGTGTKLSLAAAPAQLWALLGELCPSRVVKTIPMCTPHLRGHSLRCPRRQQSSSQNGSGTTARREWSRWPRAEGREGSCCHTLALPSREQLLAQLPPIPFPAPVISTHSRGWHKATRGVWGHLLPRCRALAPHLPRQREALTPSSVLGRDLILSPAHSVTRSQALWAPWHLGPFHPIEERAGSASRNEASWKELSRSCFAPCSWQ